jgi:p-cumate 2,3-dioxygenase subunit alpha
MSLQSNLQDAIHVDSQRNLFKVARKNFTDADIWQLEREQIFNRCWLYLGHASEVADAGDFLTGQVISVNGGSTML